MSKKGKSSLAKKIRSGKKVILYELLPPPADTSPKDLDNLFLSLNSVFATFPIDAINLPEVREERRSGVRVADPIPKSQPRIIASYLKRYGDWEMIVNRPIVYLSWNKQKKWLTETYNKFQIRNFIFVGGESGKINYPGMPVTAAAKLVRNELADEFPEIFLGGITIPTRSNEADRVLAKTLCGIEYFTSQVFFDSAPIKKLLQKYQALCQKNRISPKMIFLTFAPLGREKDMELMEWLGINVPFEIKKRIIGGWLGLGFRSIKICAEILEDILQFMQKERIRVPVGINVGHITRSNFELSFMLLDRLSKIYLR